MSSNTTTTKRIDSTKSYIDALSQEHSKLNIVRVDLSYKKPYSNEVTLEEANKDFDRMLNNRRSKPTIFKDQVGYICKREFTEDRGVHFHAVFIYDGQKVQKDAFKGDQIGQYWNKDITQGKGSHHNCNRNDYKDRGVGMLDHKDSDKREILNEALAYLCKAKQTIEPIKASKKDRAFTRGTIAKSKKKVGRPRGD